MAKLINANDYPCLKCEAYGCGKVCSELQDWLNSAVDAMEVVHGRWMPQEYSHPEGNYHLFHCSECGIPNAFERNYCPSCGAKMDGE